MFFLHNHAVTRRNFFENVLFHRVENNARLLIILQSCIHFIGGSENMVSKELTSQAIKFQEHA